MLKCIKFKLYIKIIDIIFYFVVVSLLMAKLKSQIEDMWTKIGVEIVMYSTLKFIML